MLKDKKKENDCYTIGALSNLIPKMQKNYSIRNY